jgi:hypothetical protein
MRKNHGSKLKSIAVVMTMVLAALTASIVMFGSVSANPNNFNMSTPAAGSYHKLGNTIYVSWTASNSSWINYSVYINGTEVAANISSLSYNWVTTNLTVDDIGAYGVNVIAWNTTGDGTGTEAAGGNRTVYLTVGIPGYSAWYGGNYAVTGTNNVTKLYGSQRKGKVLNTSTESLKYGYTGNIVVNTSAGKGWTGATSYYLFYPVYTGSDIVSPFNLSWKLYAPSGVPTPKFTTGTADNYFENIRLNRSGLWIIDDGITTDANMSTMYTANGTVPAWFWVNSSKEMSVTASPDSVKYGDRTKITITPTGGGTGTKIVDVRAYSNNQTIFGTNPYATGGTYSFWTNGSITAADRYDVYTYMDNSSDDTLQYWDHTTPFYYDYNYGNGTIGIGTAVPVDRYGYPFCGPYDPPEFTQANTDIITVAKGVPEIDIVNDTIYWGFGGNISVNVTDAYLAGLTAGSNASILVKNVEGTYLTNGTDPTNLTIKDQGNGNYSINFSRGAAAWKNLYTTYANGTWYIFYSYDADGDGVYEWNGSKNFQVSGSPPSARIVIDNDGNGTAADKKVNVPIYPGTGAAARQNLTFTVFGNTITGAVTDFYGDDAWEDNKNITISGDILYPVTPTWITEGKWYAWVTPVKPGGSYTIAVDWNTTNSVLEETISIVNGTSVTASTDVLYVGQHTNITVTVLDMDGDPVKTATVWLIKKSDSSALNSTTGDNTAGNGYNGEYTFWLIPGNFTSAPDNITIAAQWTTTRHGYANIEVQKQHNMIVNVTPEAAYAGNSTEYTVTVTVAGGGAPSETGLTVALYNETGALVTGSDAWTFAGDAAHIESRSLSGGTYYLYAYNTTHDSRGNNATIVIEKYVVTPTPDALAWLIDIEANLTFMIEPAFSGTLHLENMTGLPNCSAGGQEFAIQITDGVGTLTGVNATTLGNVTFDFAPNGGARRPADGLLRVTTATATPTPGTIYLDIPALVTIKLTHPYTGDKIKSGVRVGLDRGLNLSTSILAKLPSDQFTDANGEVQFSITAEASGNVTIYIMNGTDPENPFVIKAAVRKTMIVETDEPIVNEGDDFTVTALYNGEPITDATVTFTFAGDIVTTTTGTATLTAPYVGATVDYTVKAAVDGYADAQTQIKIMNLPALNIIINQDADSNGKYASPAVVIVSDDAGNLITGATVTFGAASEVTVNGQATISVSQETTDTITATMTGFQPGELTVTLKPAGIPGFELLTLVAALGVALILLRRRRH